MSQKKKKRKKKSAPAGKGAKARSESGSREPDRIGRVLADEPVTSGALLSGTLRMVASIGWRGVAVLALFQLPGAIATWQAADQLTLVLITVIPQVVAIGAVTDLGLQRVQGAPPDLMGAIVKGLVRFPFLLLAMIIAQLIVMALALLLLVPAGVGYGGFALYPDSPALGVALYVLAALLVVPCAIPAVRRYLAYQLVAPLTITGEFRVVDVLDVSRSRMQGHLKAAFVPALVFMLFSSQIAGLGLTGLVGNLTPSPAVQAAAYLVVALLDLPLNALAVVLFAKLARDE